MIQKENIGGVYVIPSYESSFGKFCIVWLSAFF